MRAAAERAVRAWIAWMAEDGFDNPALDELRDEMSHLAAAVGRRAELAAALDQHVRAAGIDQNREATMWKVWICEGGWWRVLASYGALAEARASERTNRLAGSTVRRTLAGSPVDRAMERRSLRREPIPKKGR